MSDFNPLDLLATFDFTAKPVVADKVTVVAKKVFTVVFRNFSKKTNEWTAVRVVTYAAHQDDINYDLLAKLNGIKKVHNTFTVEGII